MNWVKMDTITPLKLHKNNYTEENKIQYVHGLAYKPHSQGVCEIVHKTIKIGLMVKKLENKNKFILEEALESTISIAGGFYLNDPPKMVHRSALIQKSNLYDPCITFLRYD